LEAVHQRAGLRSGEERDRLALDMPEDLGPDEGFLHDVLRGRAGPCRTAPHIRAEPLHISVQSCGMASVELADRGVGVTRELAAGLIHLAEKKIGPAAEPVAYAIRDSRRGGG
jgi:hypothetical protein